ncbi:MAG: FecR family protein [Pseudomonadota bacterium]
MQNDTDKIEDEARQWAMKLTDEDINGDDLRAFQQWRAENPGHEVAFREADRVWRGIADLKHLRGYAVLPETPPSLIERLKHWWAEGGSGQWVTAGASFAVVAMVAIFIMPMQLDQTTYSTAVAEVRSFELEDGTQVTLGGKSTIRVQYVASARHVELVEGDALFSVTHNPEQPFVVHTGAVETRVLGTVFTVERDPGHLAVAVKEGKVRVGLPQADSQAAVLTPGQTVTADYAGAVGTVSRIDVNSIGTWVNGRISYENATLQAIVADANRYYDGEIQIADEATAALQVSISFKTDDIDSLVENLAKILDLDIKRNLLGTKVLQQREKAESS